MAHNKVFNKKVLKFFKEQGKIGGEKTAKRGKDYYVNIGLKSAKKRWGYKKPELEKEIQMLNEEELKKK